MPLQIRVMLVEMLKPVSVSLLLIMVLIGLSACGQKRDLFLPEAVSQPESVEAASVHITDAAQEERHESGQDGSGLASPAR